MGPNAFGISNYAISSGPRALEVSDVIEIVSPSVNCFLSTRAPGVVGPDISCDPRRPLCSARQQPQESTPPRLRHVLIPGGCLLGSCVRAGDFPLSGSYFAGLTALMLNLWGETSSG